VFSKEKNGDKIELSDDPISYLLKYKPNGYQNKVTFIEKIMVDLLIDGNSYVQIIRNRNARPVELRPLDYSNMSIIFKDDTLFYHNDNTKEVLSSEETMHFKLITDRNGYTGLSPIEQCKNAITWGLDLEKYGKSFFENGAKLSGVLESDRTLSTEAIDRLRDSFNNNYSKLKGANQTAVLEEGLKYKPIQIAPDQAQWLSSRQFSIEEVARIFNLPPHLLKDLTKSSFNNIEMQSQEFVSYSLMPYLTRIELEMNIKLFRRTEIGKKYVKFNVNGLLRGNIKDRSEFYSKMIQSGVMSINEIRAKEDMNKIEDGDKHVTQLNMTTIQKIGEDGTS
jgi:HK97 family phage portal protein